MAYDVPVVVASHTLGDSAARLLWNWLLRRHGLSEDTKFESVSEIARATLGLHAARLPSPFSTVVARSVSPAVALTLFTTEARTVLMTVRCMRKTLHTLPLELVAAAHGATLYFRERDVMRGISNANVGVRHISGVVDSIIDLLSQDEPMPHRAIEEQLVAAHTPVAAVRLALKLAWERGVLTYLNDTAGWNRENRKFGLTASLYPELDMSMDRGKATGELIREYFDRYGPASVRDAMWWSGLSRSVIVTAMNESARSFVAIRTAWCESPLYMYRDWYDQFQETVWKPRLPALNFLAHEDVALKAYFESRARYLGELPPRQAFNQIGEALPTIVFDGQVLGTWAWDASNKNVTFSIARGYSSTELRKEISRRAKVLSETLRLGWAKGRDDAVRKRESPSSQ